MSDQKRMEDLVKEFLKKVKEKLPDWLTEKKEHKDILAQLEEHIWSKAEELGGEEPTIESVQAAIDHMGAPANIAKEYKRRGTPKVYITEELWPLYIKTLTVAFLVIIFLNVAFIVYDAIMGNLENLWASFNIFSELGGVFFLITLIYVGLSMEGYLPEDFKSKKELEKEKQQLEKAKKKGTPISPKTGKPLKPIVKPGEKIFGGIVELIFAVFLIVFSFRTIVPSLNADFGLIIRIVGIFYAIDSCITITKGVLGNQNVSGQQIALIAEAILKFASISVFILILTSPEVIQIFFFENEELRYTTIPEDFYETFRDIWTLFIIIQVLSAIYDIFKAGNIAKYKTAKLMKTAIKQG